MARLNLKAVVTIELQRSFFRDTPIDHPARRKSAFTEAFPAYVREVLGITLCFNTEFGVAYDEWWYIECDDTEAVMLKLTYPGMFE